MESICYLHFIVCCGPEHRTPAASSAVTRHISSQQGTQHCTIQSYLHNQLSTECHMVLSTIISMVVTRGWSSFHDCENIYNCENRYPYWYYLHHPHTGPRLVTLSALHSALAPPAHKSCHVGFILGEIGGELGWVEPDTPTSTHLARTYSYITQHSGLCVLQWWRYSGAISPYWAPVHTGSAVQRGGDILFLWTRWSASASNISHLTHSASTALVLSRS